METSPERAGWRRDDMMDCWINGTVAITDETIVAFPRSKVQQHAMDLTGEPLPAEAFAVFRWPTRPATSEQAGVLRRALEGALHSSDGAS